MGLFFADLGLFLGVLAFLGDAAFAFGEAAPMLEPFFAIDPGEAAGDLLGVAAFFAFLADAGVAGIFRCGLPSGYSQRKLRSPMVKMSLWRRTTVAW